MPGHPFLKAVIENVLRNIECYNPLLHRVGGKAVLRVTGPIAYTLAIVPLLSRYQHRVADRTTASGFVYSVLSEVGATSHQALFRSHYNHLTEPLIGSARGLVARLTWLRERVSRLLKSLHRRRQ